MRFTRTLSKLLPVVGALAVPVAADAGGICAPNEKERALMPLYCQANYLPENQRYRIPAQAVAPASGAQGLLHYCDGVNCANRARKANPSQRGQLLGWAVDEMGYTITRTPATEPFQAVMRTERAKALFLMGNTKDAMADIEEAIRVDPAYLWSYTALADYFHRLDDDASALQSIERGLANNPDSKALQGRKARLEKK